jgi:hypothetical protein
MSMQVTLFEVTFYQSSARRFTGTNHAVLHTCDECQHIYIHRVEILDYIYLRTKPHECDADNVKEYNEINKMSIGTNVLCGSWGWILFVYENSNAPISHRVIRCSDIALNC